MADIGKIIGTWLKNNNWTQKKLAEKVQFTESAVQKWVKGKRHPNSDTLKKLSDIMQIDIHHFFEPDYPPVEDERLDDFVPPCLYDDFVEMLKNLDTAVPEEVIKNPLPRQDSYHAVYDIGLYQSAKLHRFKNAAGEECSAIYLAGEEVWWHYRKYEKQMLYYWNQQEKEYSY